MPSSGEKSNLQDKTVQTVFTIAALILSLWCSLKMCDAIVTPHWTLRYRVYKSPGTDV